MQKLAKIGVLSAAKMGAILGLIEGIIIAIGTVLGMGWVSAVAASVPVPGAAAIGAAMGGLIAIVAIGEIIGFLIGGFIFSAIAAFVYNIVAGFLGGVEVELK